MRCEVVAVGTELLLGELVDTNTAWLAERLAASGIDSHFHTTVGDNPARIAAALRTALSRADAVVISGGLGPTPDDVTREALAEVMGVPLERDQALAERIRRMFEERGRPMPESNARQADVPRGAVAIPQAGGTAPGLICPLGDQVVYALPGVPHELREMAERAVLPDLRARAGTASTILSRSLRTWGLSESGLAERVASRVAALDAVGNPTIAFLAGGTDGVSVRVTARAATRAAATALVDAEEAELRRLLGDVVFGVDGGTMEAAAAALLRECALSVGVAESVTGGLVAARLVGVEGASGWFRGSVVAYDSRVKFDLLGVPEGHVVSEAAAAAMAQGACKVLGADVGLSATGVAGPTGQDGQPVGTVVLGVCVDGAADVVRHRFAGGRERVRHLAAMSLLDLLRRRLLRRLAP